MQIIEQFQKQVVKRKTTLLNQLPFDNPLITLFDLAVYFEENYGNLEPSSNLQAAGILFSKMIKDLFSQKKNIPYPNTEEETHQLLLERLIDLREKGFEKELIELCQTYEHLASLENLIKIEQHDENCEVKEYNEGCFRTVIKEGSFERFQNYIKDGLKLEAATEYYSNFGRYSALEMIRNGGIVLKGAHEDDQADCFDILSGQIAADSFVEHYGIEENFNLKEKEYNTSLLIQIISFLIVYTRSRYGYFYEEQAEETPAIERIFKVWETNIKEGGRITPGPLFIDTWVSFRDRMSNVIENSSRNEIDRHLALITTRLDNTSRYVNIFEKPLLRLGDLVVFFARPLMHQNTWLPVLLPLLKNIRGKIEPEGKGERVSRSTANLAEKFRRHGFKVLVDEKLYNSKANGSTLTDIDVIALKGNWLVILQIKMTHPREKLKEAANHKKQLEKAGHQMVKTMGYLEVNWPEFRSKFDSGKEWPELKTIPLVVSTSFEFDREKFSGYLKISQFELERYLENDACLLYLTPHELLENPGCESEFFYYPSQEKLSGALLQGLIQTDALWRFLDPVVAARPIDPLLPEGCLNGSDVNKAEERFQEGNLCYGRKDYAGAEAMFREAIDFFPHHEKYYKKLGNALVMQGKRSESLEYFDKAIQLNPYFGEGYNARGLTYAEMEAYDKAYQDFQQAILFSPYDISAWSHIAQLQLARGKKMYFEQFVTEGKKLAEKGLLIFEFLTSEKQFQYREEAKLLRTILLQ